MNIVDQLVAAQPTGAESVAQPCEDDCHEFVPFANACIRCGAPYTTPPADALGAARELVAKWRAGALPDAGAPHA